MKLGDLGDMITQQHLERNKKNVMAFYDLMFNQNNLQRQSRDMLEMFTFSTIH